MTEVKQGITHWVQLKQGKKFWAEMRDTYALDKDQVHEALGVESVKDFPGNYNEAIAAIKLYLDEQTEENEPMQSSFLADPPIRIVHAHNTVDNHILAQLAEPFPIDVIAFKPQATTKDKTRCLALAYADPRAYIDRLNEVVGLDWSDRYEVHPNGLVVTCYLSISGITRSDVGESPPDDQNTVTSAAAQAFKRACVKFGLGRYLYDLPQEWVDYDEQRRQISPKGLSYLQGVIAHHSKAVSKQPEPMNPGIAALQRTRKGTALGTLNGVQLQLIVNNADQPDISPDLVNAARVLLGFIADNVGPTDPDATYNSITGTQ